MEKSDLTVEDNPRGRGLAEEGEAHGQKQHHRERGGQRKEEIHDDRVFSFRSGIRH